MHNIAGLITVGAVLLGLFGMSDWALGFAIAAAVAWTLNLSMDMRE